MKELTQTPFSLFQKLKLLANRPVKALSDVTPFTIHIENQRVSDEDLARFFKLYRYKCNQGSAEIINSKVFSYSFVVGYQHLGQLLLQSGMPDGLFGLIHTKALFQRHHRHDWRKPFNLVMALASIEQTEKGNLYSIDIEFWQEDRLTLVNRNEILAKSKGYQGKNQQSAYSEIAGDFIGADQINGKLARRYAQVSKDYNPIHLHHLSARMFGMKTSLIHGMYNVHWSLFQLESQLPNDVKKVEVSFFKPCFIPSHIELVQLTRQQYVITSKNREICHLKMTID